MRCVQWIGLSERAQRMVAGERVLAYTERGTVRVYPDGREEPQPDRPVHVCSVKREPSGEHYPNPFTSQWADEDDADTGTPLYKYTFPDGRVLYERVQADPWSSGPCVFTALTEYPKGSPQADAFRNGTGAVPPHMYFEPESLWPEEDIQAAL